MFTKERVIPLVSFAVFAFGVVGLVWGDQLGMDRLAASISPLVYVPLVFAAYVVRMRWVDRKPGDTTGWMSTILGAAIFVVLGYAALGRRDGESQTGFNLVGLLIVGLFFACFALLDVLRKRRERERAAEPRDKGPFG